MKRTTSRHVLRSAIVSLSCLTPLAMIPDAHAQDQDDGKPHDFTTLSLEELLQLKVVTASRFEENFWDAPVPLTVITSDMLRAIGANNLKDALVAYVPGMTPAEDHNSPNFGMRGIYASGQQKVLVLLNGHRLNARNTNQVHPGFNISLDTEKVKQIEVLRGPGSSLYGNVALTAVVNIITRDGADVDGVTVTVAGGDYISRDDGNWLRSSGDYLAAMRAARLVYGTRLPGDGDFLFWASTTTVMGQRIDILPEEDHSDKPQHTYAILGSSRDPAPYDVGFTARTGHFSALFNASRSSYVSPFTSGGQSTGEAFPYDRYRPLLGNGPGESETMTHTGITYERALSDALTVSAQAYRDTLNVVAVLATDPSTLSGSWLIWDESAYGLQAHLLYDFLNGAGRVLVGGQIERLELEDSLFGSYVDGEQAEILDSSKAPVVKAGHEATYSGFVQATYRPLGWLSLNAGTRVDVKDRKDDYETIVDVSPRLAAVLELHPSTRLKLSYASSFVDAPYYYRYNSLPSYKGAGTLQPERLRSVQTSLMTRSRDGAVAGTFSGFYNHAMDFIFRDSTNTAQPVQNAGFMKSIGLEGEFSYHGKNQRVHSNFTWQGVLDVKKYEARGTRIFNVSPFVGNLIYDVNPLWWRDMEEIWLNLSTSFSSRQLAPIKPTDLLDEDGRRVAEPDHENGPFLLFNLGARISDLVVDGMRLDLTLHNVLDTRYTQGGSVTFPYPQAGRSLIATLSYRFSPQSP